MPKSKEVFDPAIHGRPVPAEAVTSSPPGKVQVAAQRLLEGRTGMTRGCPAAPLNLWIALAESVYPADHPILKELRKHLTGS